MQGQVAGYDGGQYNKATRKGMGKIRSNLHTGQYMLAAFPLTTAIG